MLKQISVKNFVLMNSIQLDFTTGMSAFTGETGAGKSLLIDAIGILRGDRIQGTMVKKGEEKAQIEGCFSIPKEHPVRALLEDAGFFLEDDVLIVQRIFSTEGKSTTKLNYKNTTVSFVREILSYLIDIHSQHDSQYLWNERYHLQLLDRYCEVDVLKQEVETSYQAYARIQKQYESVWMQDYDDADLDYLTYQLNEIDDAAIQENELAELEQEQRYYASYEKNIKILQEADAHFHQEQGALSHLYEGYRILERLHDDEYVTKIQQSIMDHYYALEDECQKLHDHIEGMDMDEARSHEVNERIFLIHKIYRKYGGDFANVQKKRQSLEEQIDQVLHREDHLRKLKEQKETAYQTFYQKAQKLSQIRRQKAKELEQNILLQLKDLALQHAQFQVVFESIEGNKDGIDKVCFYVSMNAGESLQHLKDVASGGELSRLMLGLKTVFTKLQGIQTIIFDEIDTGVSGSVAFAIGKKMQSLAQTAQVFCVTHLAQVAACADQHYYVVKQQDDKKAETSIHLLNTKQRIEELAKISSDSTSSSALNAAKELLEKAHAGS